MRLLLAHNYYQRAGGEDAVFAAEVDLLRGNGHEVVQYTRTNDELLSADPLRRVASLAQIPWSWRTFGDLRSLLREHRPQAALFVNTFPLMSPSAYEACHSEGVPVLQAVGNYRLICPAAVLYREGRVCEECLGRRYPWGVISHRCYRDSRLASGVAGALFAWVRFLEAHGRLADVWLAPTAFLKRKLVEGGLAPERIAVRPNYLPADSGPGGDDRGYVLYAGRFTREKGLLTLLQAWQDCGDIPLRVAGSGPIEDEARELVRKAGMKQVKILGWQNHHEMATLQRGARFLVVPSEWYEGMPITVLEAFCAGTPVLASRLGGLVETVEGAGELFDVGDTRSLAQAARRLWEEPLRARALGAAARRKYEAQFSADSAYRSLMSILDTVLESHTKGGHGC